MSEIRSTLFSGGICANEQAQLFDRLDDGQGDASDTALAKEACGACPQFIHCLSNIGSTALDLYRHGVETSVIGGLDFDWQLLDSLGLLDLALPTEMHREFLDPRTSLGAIRQFMLTDQRARAMTGLRRNLLFPDALEAYAHTHLPPGLARKAQKTLSRAFQFTCRFLEVDRLPSWNKIPEQTRFNLLAEAYLPEVVALDHMRVTDPAWSALLLSSSEYRKLREQYSHLGANVLKLSYDKPDYRERLERADRRMKWAQQYYADNLLVSITPIKVTIANSIANDDDEAFKSKLVAYADKQQRQVEADEKRTQIIEERIRSARERYQSEPYVTPELIRRHALQTGSSTTQDFMDRLEAHLQCCKSIEEFTLPCLNTTADMSRFILHFARQDDGVEKARAALDDFVALAKKHSLRTPQLVKCLKSFTLTVPAIEAKIQRYKRNLYMLAPLRYEPSIHNSFLDYCAFHYAHDPVAAIRAYYNRLDSLQHTFGDDEDFDDSIFRRLATRGSKDIIREGHRYKDTYRKLRTKYEHDDYVEDWMVRAGAASYKDHEGKLYKLRIALRRGYLRLNLDQPLNTDTSSTYHDIVGSSQNPEDDYIQQENSLARRIHISGSITSLAPLERQALCVTFGLDWLVGGTALDTADICRQLGIPAAELENHVKRVIIPKIDAEKLRDSL